ncbi:MAG TPA: hypothetical protein VG733_11320 [Chthoniobacteraceae bacterium]|nr:hypothetical protein [Chthoniobacteraceae bacterium]
MKMRLLFALLMAAAIGPLQAGPGADAGPALRITSPDHPATWEVGFNDKVGQALRWSERDGMLYLDVTYSRITYTDTTPPSDFKTYTVAFPGVQMDPAGNLYTLNDRKQKVVIGSRATGPFGKQIALARGVDLSAHRHQGHLNASLVIGNAR